MAHRDCGEVPVPRRLLVVDDDADAQDAFAELLGLWGYEVDCVGNAEAALTSFFAKRAEVVIVDLGLPDTDGCDVIGRMRAVAADVRIIAYSGYHNLEAASLVAGATAFILKPDIEGLEHLLAPARPDAKQGSAN